jgi:hypothetical protein
MTTYNYLEDHARKNVWVDPAEDKQAIVKPYKLTGYRGVLNSLKIQWTTVSMPTKGERYHVYQIGQEYPELLGFFPYKQTWTKISDVCEQMKMIVDLYSTAGIQLPRTFSYYQVMENKNLIIAVKEQTGILFSQDTEDLYMRVYSNAFFGSKRSDTSVVANTVRVHGGLMVTNADILALQSKFNSYASGPGVAYAFVNGFKVSGIDMITTKIGDIAEVVYDASIYAVKEWQIKDLPTFLSSLDQKLKYMLHYPGAGELNIDYQSDIDLFIYAKDANGRHKGVWYNKNNTITGDAMRNLTHRDYSIPVQYVLAYADSRPEWTQPQELYVAAHIRHSDDPRALVYNANRIHELYKLTDEEIVGAITGIDSTVDVWKADALESCGYTELMRQTLLGVTSQLVESAYGYNSISKILADTPSFTQLNSGQKMFTLPYGLMYRAVGYEYDVNGKLLTYASHVEGETYTARNFNATLVEMIVGNYDTLLDEVYGDKTVTLDPNANYRMYTCPIQNGIPTNVWTDVTGSAKYAIVNNKLTWLTNSANEYTLVRSDKTFLGYSLDLHTNNGSLEFSLTHQMYRNNTISNWVMQIPMGELTLWLNGKSLIEGIDYIVKFPRIMVINKEYLINPDSATQHIDVRFTGFCQSDLTRTPQAESGFVINGLLSKNGRFNIRDDKVLRIVVRGALKDRSQLKFSESDSGVSVDALNGSPYQITDIIPAFRGLTEKTNYELREPALVIDKEIEDYLTARIPEPPNIIPNPIPSLYQLYSPFTSRIISDLKNGYLEDDRIIGKQYSDDVVRDICAPYESYLAYDPTQDDNYPDENFTIIHPTNFYVTVELQAFMYVFMKRVVKLYTKDRVDLSHFVQISAT